MKSGLIMFFNGYDRLGTTFLPTLSVFCATSSFLILNIQV